MTANTTASRLAAKLAALDLDEDEAALLGTVFGLAHQSSGREVEGFGLGVRFGSGLDAQAAVGRNLFPSRSLKGTDEELDAIVDWLGSLE